MSDSASEDYSVRSLPPIDSVELVDLRDAHWGPGDIARETFDDLPRVRLTGEAAERIASLWRELPSGMGARCHMPGFGFRFIIGGDEVCRASICFECSNIYVLVGGKRVYRGFDGDAPVASRLLDEATRTIDGRAKE